MICKWDDSTALIMVMAVFCMLWYKMMYLYFATNVNGMKILLKHGMWKWKENKSKSWNPWWNLGMRSAIFYVGDWEPFNIHYTLTPNLWLKRIKSLFQITSFQIKRKPLYLMVTYVPILNSAVMRWLLRNRPDSLFEWTDRSLKETFSSLIQTSWAGLGFKDMLWEQYCID